MKKVRFLIGTAMVLCLLVGAAPAMAITIDWSTGGSGNVGTSLTSGILTVTAKTGLTTEDPLFAGTAGTVYYGPHIDLAGKNDYNGLGVQTTGEKGGSTGISGNGGDADEALVFSFDNPPGVVASSVQLTLAGLDGIVVKNNGDYKSGDTVSLYLEFIPIESNSDSYFAAIDFGVSDTFLLDFSTLAGITDQTFGSFAVAATTGHFIVSSISFDEVQGVPEPTTLLLLGLGMVGLAASRRRFKN